MKSLVSLLSIVTFLMIALPLQAQISFELKSKGFKRDSYITLKGYEVEEDEKYMYMFSSLSSYVVQLNKKNEQSEARMVIRIYDDNDREIANNFNPKTRKYAQALAFKCGKTGLYYLSFESL